MKKNFSTKIVAFYAVFALITMAMIFTAEGRAVPFMQEGGLIQFLQLPAAITIIYGLANFENRKKAFWCIFSSLVIAMLGSFITAILCVLLLGICMLFDDKNVRKQIDSLAKE